MFVHEFSLLIAVSLPIAILSAIHAGLWAAGERETLELPVVRGYSAITLETAPAAAAAPASTPENDEEFRLAA
jgi:hypothetical protein